MLIINSLSEEVQLICPCFHPWMCCTVLSLVSICNFLHFVARFSFLLHDQLIQTGYQEIWLVKSRSVNPHTAREIPYKPGLSRANVCWICLPHKHDRYAQTMWFSEGVAERLLSLGLRISWFWKTKKTFVFCWSKVVFERLQEGEYLS